MKGLEYILYIYDTQHQSLADKFGIRKQNINKWVKGKQSIPKKYLPELEKIFEIPEEYFQKELTDIDKLFIQDMKLKNELKKTVELNKNMEKSSNGVQINFNLESTESNDLYSEDNNYDLRMKLRCSILDTEIMKEIDKIPTYSDDIRLFIKGLIPIIKGNYRSDYFEESVVNYIKLQRPYD